MTSPLTRYQHSLETHLATGITTEHTFRGALAALIESLGEDLRAVNEPQRIACGAPDLAILKDGLMIGHVEAKDIDSPLEQIARGEQMDRYRGALDNLILTDYLEFRWYVGGEFRRSARLARRSRDGSLTTETNGKENLQALLSDFLAHQPQPITSPQALAERLARLTHLIRDIIVQAFEQGVASDTLTGWRTAFAEVLIPELDEPENLGQFADMFAQTLAYGLFSARVMHQTEAFTRAAAQGYIPRTNPFLRQFFTFITGPDLEMEPYAGFVNDLIQILALADMNAILADFGQRTGGEDPMVHFYETFLAAYDPGLRERRGVYYTPMPVVSFIVRAVDDLIKSRFNLPRGLASTEKLADGTHKVLVLDPAVGTATFLYAVIDLIREDFMAGRNAGMWSGYVRDHLLPRIFGFEIMMAPYAVAHFKLALQLAGHDLPEAQQEAWAYDFQAEDRIRIYLTNTLEISEEEPAGLYGPMQFVSEEARAADAVKQEKPIMIVLGNPPYSISSSNKSEFIEALMETYKEAVRDERNIQPLSDDYIKFIRFAQDRIERTGTGIIGLITNHKYLFGLIHKGMRQELLRSFDNIFIINLHGNSVIGERGPNNIIDENVFDIKQGVAIILLIKTTQKNSRAHTLYCDIWGRREEKYLSLNEANIKTIEWTKINPIEPNFFFVPKNFDLLNEYEEMQKIDRIIKENSSGIKTHRDHFVIDVDKENLLERIELLRSPRLSNDEARNRFRLNNTRDWTLSEARDRLQHKQNIESLLKHYYYRPFDIRWIFYSSAIIELPRKKVMSNMLNKNILIFINRTSSNNLPYSHILVSKYLVDVRAIPDYGGAPYCFPLYLHPEENSQQLFDNTATSPWPPDPNHGGRVPNLDPGFVEQISTSLGLNFDPLLSGRDHPIKTAFGPEDLLAYAYAVFHSPTYRERYAEFLKIDFPRLPITTDPDLFRRLVALGRALIALHLMESPRLHKQITHFPIAGENRVAPRGGYPKYTPPDPENEQDGRVHINREQYFEGIPPAVWEFEIGGYQVLHKWLKDRRDEVLSYDDLTHYQQVVVALQETIRLMAEIDKTIPGWPLP